MADTLGVIPFWYDGPMCGGSFPNSHVGKLNAWGTVKIGRSAISGGNKSQNGLNKIPGACDVKVSRGRKLDKKAASGRNGGTISSKGTDFASVTITTVIWTNDQLQQMTALLDDIDPRMKTPSSVTAFDVQHPALRMRGIRSIVIETIDGPEFKAGGSASFTIKAHEWTQPANSTKPAAIAPVSRALTSLGNVLDTSEHLEGDGFDIGSGTTTPATPKVRAPGKR